MGSPLVSVLVPAYTAEAYIGDCLRSILAQTYPNVEIIVVDDCSPDGTYEAAVEAMRGCPEATVLRNHCNLGNRENFRKLLAMANGPLVKFVCSDDLLAPEALTRLVTAIEWDPRSPIATSYRAAVDAKGDAAPIDERCQPPVPLSAVMDGWDAGNNILYRGMNWIGEPTTVLFRRQYLPLEGLYKLGGVAPERNLDVVWWLKLLSKGPLAIIADRLSTFRVHGGQITKRAGIGSLVLAWYDLIVGGRQLGFLADPQDEMAAWGSLANVVQENADAFKAGERERARHLLQTVAARLEELCAA